MSSGTDPDREPSVAATHLPWWQRVEIDWLGLIRPPLMQRLKAARWHPDGETEYCPRCGRTTTAFEILPIVDEGPQEEFAAEGTVSDCSSCFGRRMPWDQYVRLGTFDGELRESVLETKFERSRSSGKILGELLGAQIRLRLRRLNPSPAAVVIVPIPMSPLRRIVRGIDHTHVIAAGVRSEIAGSTVAPLLRRSGLRPTQTRVAPSNRPRNVKGTFSSTRHVREVEPRSVVIVLDDVRTTGATLREACRTLRQALGVYNPQVSGSVRIYAVSVAVAESRVRKPGSDAGRRTLQTHDNNDLV